MANMAKYSCENKSELFILLILHLKKKIPKIEPVIEAKHLKVGENYIMMFLRIHVRLS